MMLLRISLPFPVQMEAIVLLEAETETLVLVPLDCKHNRRKENLPQALIKSEDSLQSRGSAETRLGLPASLIGGD